MTITLIFLACIMATIIFWLLRQTFNVQPWVSDSVADAVSGNSLNTKPQTIALTTFLAVATSLFALFASAYTLRMNMPDWRPMNEPMILWVNTGFLVFASFAYQWSRWSVGKLDAEQHKVSIGLGVAGLFSLLFLIGQLTAWQQLNENGMYVSTNPSISFFYVLTALHGLHLLGGLYVWARSVIRVFKGTDIKSIRLSVELCAVYWHFMLLVWVLLFGLMIAT
ncbi:MAG TPA: cytochrome c oxidase subunit 3 [Woeseiaceae bacterium]|nr:cytochrome c oxidase subunit 3 [Woeseiaceae bacterium]